LAGVVEAAVYETIPGAIRGFESIRQIVINLYILAALTWLQQRFEKRGANR
jgi:hypothetical protein